MKIILGGETFDFDAGRHPMSEALAIEKAWGRRYAEWESELAAGSAEAFCVLAWLIWRREGRDVKLSDILEGAVEFDFAEFLDSWMTKADKGADPTAGAASQSAPDGTPTTQPSTRRSSRAS